MLSLDPIKLLIIGIVALVVLGPDKLPAAARKASSLWQDLQRMRTSLQSEVQKTVGDLGFTDELAKARHTIGQVTSLDPRQALYRAVGIGSSATGGVVGSEAELIAVPGVIDISKPDPDGTHVFAVGNAAAAPAPPAVAFDPADN